MPDKPTHLIMDDPHMHHYSEEERENVLEWWKAVMEPRGEEPRLVVQSRLHEFDEEAYELCRKLCQSRLYEQDLTGVLPESERENWELLKLPIQKEE